MLGALSGGGESYARLLDDDGGAGDDEGIGGSSERSAGCWEHSLEVESPMQDSSMMMEVLVMMRERGVEREKGVLAWSHLATQLPCVLLGSSF